MIITKAKIIAVLLRNLPYHRMEKNALINAIFPNDFDQLAEEISGSPNFEKTRFVDFSEAEKYEKTLSYMVRDKKVKVLLGYVRWHPPFYGYSFFPEQNTIYDPMHLAEIINFIEVLMFLHQDKKQKALNHNNGQ